jgi:C4-dicarboxylate transporter DctM subunit
MLVWLFGSFGVLLAIGVPIAVCLGLAAILALVMTGTNVSLIVAAQTMFNGVNSYSLMAIPFFILCGNMMSGGGLSKKLVDFIKIFLGRIKGGLSIVTIVASMFFAAISGSCPATTAAIGGVMIPEMNKTGYDKKFSAATAAAGGIVGQIIPPSIPMVTYAVLAEVSVSTLFLTGFGPGILLGLLMMGYAYYYSRKNNVPVIDIKISGKIIWEGFKDSIWALIMPVIILGGIYSGLFTPTEAGAIAAVYGFLVGMFVYKSLTLEKLPKIIVDTAVASSVIMLIMGTVATFNYVLTIGQIPQIIANSLLSLTTNKYIILILFNIVVLIAGMFMSSSAAIALLTPILLPILTSVGINKYLIGIIFIVNMGIGMITPPVGNCLYVACNIGNIKFEPLVKATMPYVWVSIIGLLMITFIEPISMFLVYLIGAPM